MTRSHDISWTDDSRLIETENKIVRALANAAESTDAARLGPCLDRCRRSRRSCELPYCLEIPPSVTANIAVHAAKPGSEIASADGSMCQQVTVLLSDAPMVRTGEGDVLHPEGEETHDRC